MVSLLVYIPLKPPSGFAKLGSRASEVCKSLLASILESQSKSIWFLRIQHAKCTCRIWFWPQHFSQIQVSTLGFRSSSLIIRHHPNRWPVKKTATQSHGTEAPCGFTLRTSHLSRREGHKIEREMENMP